MNIERYAQVAPQAYTGEIPGLLRNLLLSNHFPTILDCGCGDGSLVHAILKTGLVKSSTIFAIDLSKSRINLIKKISSKIKAAVDSSSVIHIE